MSLSKKEKNSIIKTLAWFDVFNYPLTINEIQQYTGIIIKSPLDLEGLIGMHQNFFHLQNRSSIIQNRLQTNKHAEKLWKKIYQWSWIFKITPFLKMVAVCNTLSFNNPDKESDIDLFIVTERSHLFTARIIITFLTSIFGLRRHGNKIKGRFCLSFWCTENALDFSKITLEGEDPYLAYWLKDLKPLFGYEIYKKMIEINRKWMEKYINYNYRENKNQNNLKLIKFASNILFRNRFSNFIEKMLQRFQLARCQQKSKKLDSNTSSIIINKDMLKFHNIDMRKHYRKEWRKKLKKLGIG